MSRLISVSLIPTEYFSEPVTPEQVKDYLKIDYSDEDTEIGLLITSARQKCEKLLGLALVDTNVKAIYRQNKGGCMIELAYLPIKELDSDGNPIITGLPDDAMFIGTQFDGWIDTKETEIKINYLSGWPEGTMPEIFRTAIKKQVAWDYEHRGDDEAKWVSQVNQKIAPEVIDILNPFRQTLHEYLL